MTATTTEAPKTFDDITAILRAEFPHYEERPQQAAMAHAIEETLAAPQDGDLPPAKAVQAGCGTGKSYALLIPAALSGKRVVIATGTIALQAQLVDKDLPNLAAIIPDFPKYALLKGRSNYMCAVKLSEGPEVANLPALQAAMADQAHIGDKEALAADGIEVSAEDWRLISATSSECPGASSCPFSDTCKTENAKREAASSKIVVTNFAMLGLDMVLGEQIDGDGEGSGPLLGDYDYLFCDEADGLDNAMRGVLAAQIPQYGIQQLASGAEVFVQANDLDSRGDHLKESVNLIKALDAFGAALPKTIDRTAPAADPKGGDMDTDWFTKHYDQVDDLIRALTVIGDRIRRVEVDDIKAKIRRNNLSAQADNARNALLGARRAANHEMARYNTWVKHAKADQSFWTVHFSPVDISNRLRDGLWSKQKTILTSATLAVGGRDFSYFTRTLGLEHASTLDVGTPFDYAKQAMLFVPPPSAPEPKESSRNAWKAYLATTTDQLVRASGGGALLLFTSREVMNDTYAMLAPRFKAMGLTVLIQDGSTPNGKLAAAFREDKDSVLFGLKSFFVGLDVPGDSLRLVVIDKLPFPVPTEPVFKARKEAEEAAGRVPFASLSIPMMTLDLTQGFGRLIRSHTDRGVVAILDSRLSYTPSGWHKRVINGLPDCPVEVETEQVTAFFDSMRANAS